MKFMNFFNFLARFIHGLPLEQNSEVQNIKMRLPFIFSESKTNQYHSRSRSMPVIRKLDTRTYGAVTVEPDMNSCFTSSELKNGVAETNELFGIN